MDGGEAAAAVTTSRATLPADRTADAFGLRALVAVGAEAALRTDDAALVAGALRSLEGVAAAVHLLPHGVTPSFPVASTTTVELGGVPLGALHLAGRPSPEPGTGADESTWWVVYTSGSTGEPKAVRHRRSSLARTVVDTAAARALTWGLLYDPNRMAGLQVLVQALDTAAPVVAPDAELGLRPRIEAMIAGGVDALSATPTLWRRILSVPGLDRWPLRRITLGGEIADQLVLDALAQRFPTARITHVFASTETGAAFAVRDGRAGFPASFLVDPPGGIELEVRDGILYVHNPASSVAGADGFASTGDLVEVEGDRVRFRGRASGVVNVGGTNVWPEEVEALLREHPEVADAVVTSLPNPLAGNLLVASIVVTPSADPTEVRKGLRRWVRDRAPAAQVPAKVEVVDDLVHATTGKARR